MYDHHVLWYRTLHLKRTRATLAAYVPTQRAKRLYDFGRHEDGRSKAPVADGTNRKIVAHYVSPNYGRAQGNEWHERNYPTAKAPRKSGPRPQNTRNRTPKGTNVWVPEQTDLQRHRAILGNNNHTNH